MYTVLFRVLFRWVHLIYSYTTLNAIIALCIAALWLGASDERAEGSWIWAHSGQPLAYTNWIYYAPDNVVDLEHCLSILNWSQGKWEDDYCGLEMEFVCEC